MKHAHCKLIAKNETGQTVGFLIAKKNANAFVIDTIGTLPEFFGHGIGTKLFEAGVEQAKHLGCNTIRMITDPKSKAFEWYKRLGFEKNGWVEVERGV